MLLGVVVVVVVYIFTQKKGLTGSPSIMGYLVTI
jgi:hypothetical protein